MNKKDDVNVAETVEQIAADVVEVADRKANFYIQEGLAMSYQTKVLQDRPLVDAGKAEPSSASPVVQAYATKTLNESADGEQKKRGRKPKL